MEELDFCIGYTFFFTDRRDGGHLHFIASDVQEPDVVVFNFTTLSSRTRDLSCVVQAGELREIVRESVVSYYHAEITPLSDLDALLYRGGIEPSEPITDKGLMGRVWDGARVSQNCPIGVKSLLVDQAFIDSW